ncbi:tetratricopeptide repeat-containing sulfotransferase family protein [Flavisphingopyxis soli]|nr:tetratricopeptide repeat-containing sulfotransferase family protein [Sphingorhabdus soli]
MESVLDIVDSALPDAADRAPYLALAGQAALRLNRADRAIGYLVDLLALHPDDRATKANLANALLGVGDFARALEIVAGAPEASLARIEAYIHQHQDRLDEAVPAYRRAIAADANDLASWNNLGNVLAQLGEVDDAIRAFERAITLAPADIPIYLNLADLLMRSDLQEARLRTLKDAQSVAPENPQVLTELGLAYAANDDLENAIATLREAIDRSPDFGAAQLELGLIFETLNRVDDLAALVEQSNTKDAPPELSFLLAWQARREGRFDDAAALAEAIPETILPLRRYHLIGGIADRRGDAATAFPAFEQMNREAVALSPPLAGPSFRSKVEADLAVWTNEWAGGWVNVESADEFRDPIFLVGFPRSGTTLLDTMLMGLPTLSVLEERPMVARTLALLGDDALPTLTPDRIGELRAAYFEYAREYGWADDRWLVDKHPLNMARVPFIQRLFPKARFILAERHPYDVVLSCFMANFQLNVAMRSFTSLDEAAKTYDAVFSAWHRAQTLLPFQSHAVRYERLVVDSAAELTPLVEWLGEEWHDDLLDHQQTASARGRVRTASYSQIGEKLYTHASDRWRRYSDHLAPVMPILRPWAERMGYETE